MKATYIPPAHIQKAQAGPYSLARVAYMPIMVTAGLAKPILLPGPCPRGSKERPKEKWGEKLEQWGEAPRGQCFTSFSLLALHLQVVVRSQLPSVPAPVAFVSPQGNAGKHNSFSTSRLPPPQPLPDEGAPLCRTLVPRG